VRAEALEHGVEAVMERARPALEIMETAIREHPTTGQAGRLGGFSRRCSSTNIGVRRPWRR
jgi:hypothetical protein